VWRRPLAVIRHTQRFNIFTEHTKKCDSSKGSRGFLTMGFDGVADGATQRARERRHATRGVEIEREGCCSARLAAHFAKQPVGTIENSEEEDSLFGEGESRRGAAWGAGHGGNGAPAGFHGRVGRREQQGALACWGRGKLGRVFSWPDRENRGEGTPCRAP
jgi:hypothetical protein